MNLETCPNCGNHVNEVDTYCPNCSVKLNHEKSFHDSFNDDDNEPKEKIVTVSEEVKKGVDYKFLIFSTAVIVLIIIFSVVRKPQTPTPIENDTNLPAYLSDTIYNKGTADINKESIWGSDLYLAEALVISEEFVKKYLISPSTAIFPTPTPTSLDGVTYSNNQYTVISYVDSQNRFGAMMRTNYIATLRRTGHQRYSLVDIKLYE